LISDQPYQYNLERFIESENRMGIAFTNILDLK